MGPIDVIKLGKRYTVRIEKTSDSEFESVQIFDSERAGEAGTSIPVNADSIVPKALIEAARLIDRQRQIDEHPRSVSEAEVKKIKSAIPNTSKKEIIKALREIGFAIRGQVPSEPGSIFVARQNMPSANAHVFVVGKDGYAHGVKGTALSVPLEEMAEHWIVIKVY